MRIVTSSSFVSNIIILRKCHTLKCYNIETRAHIDESLNWQIIRHRFIPYKFHFDMKTCWVSYITRKLCMIIQQIIYNFYLTKSLWYLFGLHFKAILGIVIHSMQIYLLSCQVTVELWQGGKHRSKYWSNMMLKFKGALWLNKIFTIKSITNTLLWKTFTILNTPILIL